DNTLKAYRRDLTKYLTYLKKEAIYEWEDVNHSVLTQFLYQLNDNGSSSATIARTLSTLRKFHQFLMMEGVMSTDPTVHLESPQKTRTLPKILSTAEVNQLLDIDTDDPFSIRNKVMFEMMYATGLRVSELIHLSINDLQLTMGFVRSFGKGSKERIVPLGDPAKQATELYLEEARPYLLRG